MSVFDLLKLECEANDRRDLYKDIMELCFYSNTSRKVKNQLLLIWSGQRRI